MTHIGYKKCTQNKIVKLEILGEHNEDRPGIVNKDFASMRCNRAKVLEIYDMNDTSKQYDSAISSHDKTFKYEKGVIVWPLKWDMNMNEIGTDGIHYYLSEEAARMQDYCPRDCVKMSWYANGSPHKICTYKNGMLNGKYDEYYPDNKYKIRCSYKNDRLDGNYASFYENGSLLKSCVYKNGKLNGPYQEFYQVEEFYQIPQPVKMCTYNNGKLEGIYKEFYPNGQLKESCTYKLIYYYPYHKEPCPECEESSCNYEVYDKIYESFYENGNAKLACAYIDGKLEGKYETWYEKGCKHEIYHYKRGEKVGSYEIWNSIGQLYAEGVYHDCRY